MDLGLSGVKLMISDGGKGIKNAVVRPFLGISWQMSATSPRVHARPCGSKHALARAAILLS